MWEREPGVVCVRWAARASPRLLGGLVAAGSAAMSLDGVSGALRCAALRCIVLCRVADWHGCLPALHNDISHAPARPSACLSPLHPLHPLHPPTHPNFPPSLPPQSSTLTSGG